MSYFLKKFFIITTILFYNCSFSMNKLEEQFVKKDYKQLSKIKLVYDFPIDFFMFFKVGWSVGYNKKFFIDNLNCFKLLSGKNPSNDFLNFFKIAELMNNNNNILNSLLLEENRIEKSENALNAFVKNHAPGGPIVGKIENLLDEGRGALLAINCAVKAVPAILNKHADKTDNIFKHCERIMQNFNQILKNILKGMHGGIGETHGIISIVFMLGSLISALVMIRNIMNYYSMSDDFIRKINEKADIDLNKYLNLEKELINGILPSLMPISEVLKIDKYIKEKKKFFDFWVGNFKTDIAIKKYFILCSLFSILSIMVFFYKELLLSMKYLFLVCCFHYHKVYKDYTVIYKKNAVLFENEQYVCSLNELKEKEMKLKEDEIELKEDDSYKMKYLLLNKSFLVGSIYFITLMYLIFKYTDYKNIFNFREYVKNIKDKFLSLTFLYKSLFVFLPSLPLGVCFSINQLLWFLRSKIYLEYDFIINNDLIKFTDLFEFSESLNKKNLGNNNSVIVNEESNINGGSDIIDYERLERIDLFHEYERYLIYAKLPGYDHEFDLDDEFESRLFDILINLMIKNKGDSKNKLSNAVEQHFYNKKQQNKLEQYISNYKKIQSCFITLKYDCIDRNKECIFSQLLRIYINAVILSLFYVYNQNEEYYINLKKLAKKEYDGKLDALKVEQYCSNLKELAKEEYDGELDALEVEQYCSNLKELEVEKYYSNLEELVDSLPVELLDKEKLNSVSLQKAQKIYENTLSQESLMRYLEYLERHDIFLLEK